MSADSKEGKGLSAEAKPFIPGGTSSGFRGPPPRNQPDMPSNMPSLENSQPLPLYSRGSHAPPAAHYQQPPVQHPGRGYGGPVYQQHPQHFAPTHGQPHMPIPRQHGPPFTSPTGPAPPHPSPVPESKPYFVVLLGGPLSGKTSIAESLARKADFICVKNDRRTLSGYARLDDELKKRTRVKGFVLDDFIGSCREDAYYLQALLQKHKQVLDSVVYLDIPVADAMVRAKAEEIRPEQMAQHAAHYDVAMAHFNNIILRPLDIPSRTVDDIADEVLREVRSNPPGSHRDGVRFDPLQPFFQSAMFVGAYDFFLKLRGEITDFVGSWDSALSEAAATLDYATFVRKNYSLRRYWVAPNFVGNRVMVYKRRTDVFLFPMKRYGAFHLQEQYVPPSFQTQDDFVLDGIAVELHGDASPTIFVTDVLYARDMPKGSLRDVRQKKLKDVLQAVSSPSMFIYHPVYPINQLGELMRREWKFDANGLIFYPPGRYQGGLDARTYTFDFPDSSVVFRVWDGKECTLDPVLQPKGSKVLGWAFSVFVREANGEEYIFLERDVPVQVQVASAIAEEGNINDGDLLEYARLQADKKNPRSSGYWKFKRRVDIYMQCPSMVGHVASVVNPDWSREALLQACASLTFIPSPSDEAASHGVGK